MTPTGPTPLLPATIFTYITNLVTFGTDPNGNSVMTPYPGYTNTLPGSLISDICGTDTAAVYLMDQARIDLINSMTPFGANNYLLIQQGNLAGIPQQSAVNTTVNVVFTGTAGYIIPIGFIVGDGTNTYSIVNGGIIQTGGTSQPLTAIALNNSASFAVPANTVTQVVSSVATGYTLTCNNPIAGTPATGTENIDTYRARVLGASVVACQGTPAYLKTVLGAIPGVVYNQISVQQGAGGWEIIVGGGDAYSIAYAIYQAVPDLSTITGSVLTATAVTLANPGVMTTNKNHLYTTGQVITVTGSTNTNFNGSFTITVLTNTTFSLGVNTTSFGAYTGGGVVSPNLRNNTVTILDYPDIYSVTFVEPPQQTVTIVLSWNTTASSFVSASVFNQLAQAAIVTYINGLGIGQPINLFVLNNLVFAAVASVLTGQLISVMNWTVDINGVATSPTAGTEIIVGDPESYMTTSIGGVTVTQI